MHLQRSKTIANMCYSKQKLRDQQISQTISEKSEEIHKSNGHASTGTGSTSAVISVEQNQSELPRYVISNSIAYQFSLSMSEINL